MSTIEERLARDIAAVTGGVVVTDSDVRDARDVLDSRIDDRRQRNRRRTLAAAVAAAAVIPVVGVAVFQAASDDQSAPPVTSAPDQTADNPFLAGEAPTPDLLQGVWRVDGGTVAMRFSAPDKVAFDQTGRLFDEPQLKGTYEIQGDQITVTVPAGRGCAGRTFSMAASLPEKGTMHVMTNQPGGSRCSPTFAGAEVFEQILPPGPVFAGIRFPDKLDWRPWPGRGALHGMWAAEGGRYVLELDRDDSYYVADTSGTPIDRGHWSYRDRALTLTSSAGSVECSKGDQAVLVDLEYVNPGTSAMQWTVEANTCGGAWATKDWFLVPLASN
jgi:hypothetical protein